MRMYKSSVDVFTFVNEERYIPRENRRERWLMMENHKQRAWNKMLSGGHFRGNVYDTKTEASVKERDFAEHYGGRLGGYLEVKVVIEIRYSEEQE